jgi:hypothetical protein
LNITGDVAQNGDNYYIGTGNTGGTAYENIASAPSFSTISAYTSNNSSTAYLVFTVTLADETGTTQAVQNASGTAGQTTATWNLGSTTKGTVTLTAASGVILVDTDAKSATFAVATYTSSKATSTAISDAQDTPTDLITSIAVAGTGSTAQEQINNLAGVKFNITISFDASTDQQYNDSSLS